MLNFRSGIDETNPRGINWKRINLRFKRDTTTDNHIKSDFDLDSDLNYDQKNENTIVEEKTKEIEVETAKIEKEKEEEEEKKEEKVEDDFDLSIYDSIYDLGGDKVNSLLKYPTNVDQDNINKENNSKTTDSFNKSRYDELVVENKVDNVIDIMANSSGSIDVYIKEQQKLNDLKEQTKVENDEKIRLRSVSRMSELSVDTIGSFNDSKPTTTKSELSINDNMFTNISFKFVFANNSLLNSKTIPFAWFDTRSDTISSQPSAVSINNSDNSNISDDSSDIHVEWRRNMLNDLKSRNIKEQTNIDQISDDYTDVNIFLNLKVVFIFIFILNHVKGRLEEEGQFHLYIRETFN
jgi:hypothetical protein